MRGSFVSFFVQWKSPLCDVNEVCWAAARFWFVGTNFYNPKLTNAGHSLEKKVSWVLHPQQEAEEGRKNTACPNICFIVTLQILSQKHTGVLLNVSTPCYETTAITSMSTASGDKIHNYIHSDLPHAVAL